MMKTNAHKIDELSKIYTSKQIISASVIVTCEMLCVADSRERKDVFDIYLAMLESCLDQAGNLLASVIAGEDGKLNIKDK